MIACGHALSQVVINEIFYDPPENTKLIEFVELHNPGAAAVNLAGWRLEDGVAFTFPAGATIPAGGYFVVAQDAPQFQAQFGFAAGGVFVGALSSDGERLQLRNSSGVLVDEVSYGVGFPWPTAAKGTGSSAELIHHSLDNDLGGSWRSSGLPDNPAPVTTYIAPTDPAWRYRKGTSEASAQREAWRQTGFAEDASWLTGKTSVGYGDAVRKPIGDWVESRLRKLGENDLSRHNSANESGFGRDISKWVGKQTVLPTNVISRALVGRNKNHPAVFPVDLPLFFIKLLSPENGLVVDPFAGSGTTGIAALSVGRDCVLIDNNTQYCQEALKRLREEAMAKESELLPAQRTFYEVIQGKG